MTNHGCFTTNDEIKKIETGIIGDTKKRVSKVLRELEKKSGHKCIIPEGGNFEEDNVVIIQMYSMF